MKWFAWLAVAWVTPAAVAGALGWTGVWGSTGAFGDYLSPLPISGGFLHLVTLGSVSALLATQPWSARVAAYTRGVFLAVSLLGLVLLLDLNKLYVAATTDVALNGLPWQANPVGLFLLTDGLLAQLFLAAFEGEAPEQGRKWLQSLALALCVPLAYALVALLADPRRDEPFTLAGSRPGSLHADEVVFVYTRIAVESESFRQAAASHAGQFDPRLDVNAEDVAVLYFTSLGAARQARSAEAKATYCMYEDGTPPRWLPGAGDCFSGHESFHERLTRARAAVGAGVHPDVAGYLARVEACRGLAPIRMPPGMHDGNTATRACAGLDQLREALQRQFSADPAMLGLLQAAR